MKTALEETNWDQILGVGDNKMKANDNFTKALIDAAIKSERSTIQGKNSQRGRPKTQGIRQKKSNT